MEREPKMWICLGKEISNEKTPLMHEDSLKILKKLGRGGKSPPPYPQKTSFVVLI
jgi:hypothetical protein